jgi:hypothetical protein
MMVLILAGAARASAQDVTGCCQSDQTGQTICINDVPANMCDGKFVQGGVCTASPFGTCPSSAFPGSSRPAPAASHGTLTLVAIGLVGVGMLAVRRPTR